MTPPGEFPSLGLLNGGGRAGGNSGVLAPYTTGARTDVGGRGGEGRNDEDVQEFQVLPLRFELKRSRR
jgi:hypothetical protein